MRRTLAGVSTFGFVIAIAVAIVAARSGSSSRLPIVAKTAAVMTATGSVGGVTTTTVSWDVPVSRSDAIAKVQATSDAERSSTLAAKLMMYGDFMAAAQPGVTTPYTPDSLQVWAVEILGTYSPAMAPSPPYHSGDVIIDAHDGSVIAWDASPRPNLSYWDDLPDHSSS